jgi:hypothetical protein
LKLRVYLSKIRELLGREIRELLSRSRVAYPPPVEREKKSQLSDTEIESLRGRFPILAELSTGFIRGLSATELLTLERASFKQRESEKFRDTGEKLA